MSKSVVDSQMSNSANCIVSQVKQAFLFPLPPLPSALPLDSLSLDVGPLKFSYGSGGAL